MNSFIRFLSSSIGRKYVMAVTGLSLTLFLLVHMAGNLTLYAGNDAFNEYADLLESNPLLPLAEAGLLVLFVVHILFAVLLTGRNKTSRSDKYQSSLGMGAKTVASTTMWITGPVLLVFLVIHIWDFRISKELLDEYDLAQMVVDRLRHPVGFVIYTASIGMVGLHMWHAFQSAFQTLGVAHPRYRSLIQNTGRLITALLVAGFGGIPFYLFFTG
ncbi:succinate dehydrogenase cytochrome b subunit [Planctomycetota bacterium]|jgi:succinate dehydrogenase / fumarate reductase cytochrome b subunit|nr:succinate dehydrogenase cytochrome b subunit [Planctomycetota bacterium]